MLYHLFCRAVSWPPPRLRARHRNGSRWYTERGDPMSALGQKQTCAEHQPMSALPPCVDGSELARTFLNVCSIGRCSHVFGLLARHVGPLAIMPCADQVPINSP